MRTVVLGDVADINPRGDVVAGSDPVSFVGMAQLDAESATAVPLETRPFSAVATGYTIFRDADILAAKITPCWENGKIGQAVLGHQVGVGSTEFHVIRASPAVDRRFLMHYLRHPRIRALGELRMTGSGGQRRVPAAFLRELELPLPDLGEQRRIAGVFDRAQRLRDAHSRMSTALRTLAVAAFDEVFGAPIRHDIRTTVGDVAEVQTGPFGSLLHQHDYVVGGTPLINPMHIVDGRIQADPAFSVTSEKASDLGTYRLRVGDVVLGRRGEMGRCAIVGGAEAGFLCGTGCLVVRPGESVSSTYLRAALAHRRTKRALEDRALGATLPNLNATIVRKLPMLVPTVAEQSAYEARVRAVGERIAGNARSLALHGELLVSLRARAFRGEL